MGSKETQTLTAWESSLFGVAVNNLHNLIPGIVAVSILTFSGIWSSDFIGTRLMGFAKSPISPVLVTIILGLLIRTAINLPEMFNLGIQFAVKKVLRLGIILLGIRLTVFDVFKLGAVGIPIVAVCILGALLITTWVNQKLKLPERLGTLIAVGTSICGVTAIVAASPAIDAEEEEAAYAIAVITVFGLFATVFYPYLADLVFNGQAVQIGLFLGTSVHETAQVVGAGQIYADTFHQPTALDVATITKLVRNVFMAGVIPFMAVYYARKAQAGSFKGQRPSFGKLFPLFIIGFLGMAVLRSVGDAGTSIGGSAFGFLENQDWTALIDAVKQLAEICLVAALAGVGLSIKIKSFMALGIKPFAVGLCASAAVGIISILTIKILGSIIIY